MSLMLERYLKAVPDLDADPSLTCNQCGKTMSSLKKLRLHQKAHRQKPCRWCDQMMSVNGLPRHEKACVHRPDTEHSLVPLNGFAHQVAEWLERVHVVPKDSFVVLCQGQVPQFVKRPDRFMAEQMNHFGAKCCVTFPTGRIDPTIVDTEPARDTSLRKQPVDDLEDDFT